jgi:hypothetical protein
MLRVEVRQRALAGLANAARGADSVDDIGVSHDGLSKGQSLSVRVASPLA